MAAKKTTGSKSSGQAKKAKSSTKKAAGITPKSSAKTTKKVQVPFEQAVDARVEKNESRQWNVPPVAQTLRKPQVLLPIIALVILALVVYIFRSWFLIATVNGQFVTRAELDRELEQQYGKETLDSVIAKKLIQQEASRQNITVSQQEINDSIKQISDNLATQGQSLDSVLAARGMSHQDLEDQVKLQKMLEKLVGKNVTASDQEVQDYIDKNKDTLPSSLSEDQLKQQVKQQLISQKIETKSQSLVSDLEKKAKINYIAAF